MPRKSRTDVELGWLKALWDEAALCEQQHGCQVSITVRPMAMKATFNVTVEAVRLGTPKGLNEWSYRTMVRYPNGNDTEFLAWLWGRVHRFADEAALSDVDLERAEQLIG